MDTVIHTPRLELRLITKPEAAAMRAGDRAAWWHPDFPREDDVDGASMLQVGPDGEPDAWGSRHILLDGVAVGTIGFFGPPDPADDGVSETEIGYGLVEPARGAGLATEAVRAMLAVADAQGVRIRASVEPSNRPSIQVLAKTGFTGLRGTDDEGHLVMVRPVPA